MDKMNKKRQMKRVAPPSSSSESDESAEVKVKEPSTGAEMDSSRSDPHPDSPPVITGNGNAVNDSDSTESESECLNRTPKKRKKSTPKKGRILSSSEDDDDADKDIESKTFKDDGRENHREVNFEPIPGCSSTSPTKSRIYHSPTKLNNGSPSGHHSHHLSGHEESEANTEAPSDKFFHSSVHDRTTLPLSVPADIYEGMLDSDHDDSNEEEEEEEGDMNKIYEENGSAEEPNQPSSSSDTDDEAHYSFGSVSSSSMDSDTLAARTIIPDEVPLLNRDLHQHHELAREFTLLSSTEFAFSMHVEHFQSHHRIVQYTPTCVEAFRNMDCYFDLRTQSFRFPIQKDLYLSILDALGMTEEDGGSFRYVIYALSRYRSLIRNPVENPLESLTNLRGFSDLRDYQLESIRFAVSREGRVMIADQPGMGKTLVGIMTSLFYKKEWPMLIFCSRNLQSHWCSELKKWLPEGNEIQNIEDSVQYKEYIDSDTDADVVLVTYSLLQKLTKDHKEGALKEKNFRVLILDNSEKIKYNWTNTSKSVRGFLKRAKRRIFLSSNPAYGVPAELFRQLRRIDRDAFDGGNEFAGRYCGSTEGLRQEDRPTRPLTSTNYRYAQNLEELRLLLFNTVAIRHFRSQHFDLPEKRRERVLIEFHPSGKTRSALEAILEYRNDMDFSALVDLSSRDSPDTGSNKYIFKWYKLSAWAKVPLVWQWLDQFDMAEKKLIIYYRHKCMLKGLKQFLKMKEIRYIRIKTPRKDEGLSKKERSEKFNRDNKIRVALMNIEIPSVDVDLSAADTIIFTELYWVPDSIFKNENRACPSLFGKQTKKAIDVKYLVANDATSSDSIHIDQHLWETMLGKMNILFSLGLILAEDNFVNLNFDTEFVPDLDWDDLQQGSPTPSFLGDGIDMDYEPESGAEMEDDEDDLSEVPSEEFSSSDNDNDDVDAAPEDAGHRQDSSQEQSTPSGSQEEVDGGRHEEALGSESDAAIAGPSTRTRIRSKQIGVVSPQQAHSSDAGETKSGSDDSDDGPSMNNRNPNREVYERSRPLGSEDSEEEEDDNQSSSSLDDFVVPSTQDENDDPDFVPSGERRRHQNRNDDESDQSDADSSRENATNSPDEDNEEAESSSDNEPEQSVSKIAKGFFR